MNQDAGQLPPRSKNAPLAVWSLVLGILGFCCLCPFGAIPGIICGHMGLSQIRRTPETLKGNGMAMTGLVLGYVGLVLQILFFLLILPALLFPALAKTKELARRSACQNNLHQLDMALVAYCYPAQNFYPTNLNQLPTSDVSPNVFVCPGSGNKPGSLNNVEDWMDYIYVSGQGPSTPAGVPIFICPPEHHKNLGGCVLDSDHSTRWVSKPEIDSIISNALSHGAVVSKRLTGQSGGRYRSKP